MIYKGYIYIYIRKYIYMSGNRWIKVNYVVDFYPSISSIELLDAALDFASNYDNITDEEREIIMHAKTSCLHSSGSYWGKRTSSSLFDVTIMGSFDGAESCELVGSYLLHLITTKHGNNFGLYRDDGLGSH